MIRHCVYLRLRADADASELTDVMEGLGDLSGRLPGASGFFHGPNRDYELKSPDYPHGFTIDFTDQAALANYAQNPEHRALGARLVALCEGGADGIIVYDLESA